MTSTNWPTTREEMLELTPEEFEHFVADIYSARGYDTKTVQLSADRGRDVVADKNGERIVIQAKRYQQGNRVGSEEVQQYSSILHENTVDQVEIVTTSTFTNSGWRSANRINGLVPRDWSDLEDWATKVDPANIESTSEPAQETAPSTDETSPSGESNDRSAVEKLGYLFFVLPFQLTIWWTKVSIKLAIMMIAIPIQIIKKIFGK